MEKRPAIRRWKNYKFGMFIHYGLYSILGKGEWAMFQTPIDKDDYAQLMTQFKAEKFDAAHLAELAKQAGMKYMVLTTRHHDGFCLFDSKHSIGNYTVMRTPAKRDLIREYTDACREAGLGVGLYYSPMDWRCEGFFFPLMYRNSAMQMRTQCHCQVRELLSDYGKIDILWYDGGDDHWLAHGRNLNGNPGEPVKAPVVPGFWGEEELNAMTRQLQPEIMVSNRIGMKKTGDFITPERKVGNFDPETPWETCDTLSEMWGWMPNRRTMSKKEVVHLLIDVITGGGNLLLNVSPMGDGSLEPEHEKRLLEVGEWTSEFAEAIYDTDGGPVKNDSDYGGATCKGNCVYFFIKTEECTKFRLPLPGEAKIKEITALSGEPVSSVCEEGILTVTLPAENRSEIATVVRITLDRPVSEVYADFDYNSFEAFDKPKKI